MLPLFIRSESSERSGVQELSDEMRSIPLSNYLATCEVDGILLLDVIGALHRPWSFDLRTDLWGVWRIIVIFLMIVNVLFTIVAILQLHMSYITKLYQIGWLLQSIIVYTVMYHSRERFRSPTLPEHKVVLKSVLNVCQRFLTISLALHVFFVVGSFKSDDFVGAILASISMIGLILLDIWPLFFICLDAQAAVVSINRMIKCAECQTLTIDEYKRIFRQVKTLNSRAYILVDLISAIAYASFVLMLYLFIFGGEEGAKWDSYFVYIGTLLRETVLLLLALPYIAQVNDAHDSLSQVLSDTIWTGTANRATSTSDGSNTDEIDELTKSISEDKLNIMRLTLWSMTMTKPITFEILGRRIKKNEMKMQITTIVVVIAATFLGFLIDEQIREENG
jgi:hypothetical protein